MSARKKLLVMTSTFPRWEGDHEPPFVYELSRRLTSEFEVHILAPHAKGLALKERLNGLHVHRYRYAPAAFEQLTYEGGMMARLRQNPLRYLLVPIFLLAQYIMALRLIRQEKIDIIHAHWLIPQGLVASLIKLTCLKPPALLCTSHGADLFSLRGRLLTAIKKWTIDRCDHLTVVSHAMKDTVSELGITESKVDIAPMGVDLTSAFTPSDTKPDPNTLLFAGRLVEKKGLIHLINALPRIIAINPNTRLLIAGTGPEEYRLRSRAADLNISDHVEFLGAIKNQELPSFFQSGQIAIFPFVIAKSGDQEGLGLVMIEALGCGCTVIASDLPAIKDIIIDGETGKITAPGNSQAIAENVVLLMNNPEMTNKLAKTGREKAINNFDWGTTKKRYIAAINKAISHNLDQAIE